MKSQTVVVVVVVVVESCTRIKSCLSRLWIILLFLYTVSVLKKDAGYTFWSFFVCRILSALVLYLENISCSPPSMCNILHMDTHNFMVVIVFIMAQTYLIGLEILLIELDEMLRCSDTFSPQQPVHRIMPSSSSSS